jgi:hypothetical protein
MIVGRMSVSSIQGPVVLLPGTVTWPLFAPAELGPAAAAVPSSPRFLTPGPAMPSQLVLISAA